MTRKLHNQQQPYPRQWWCRYFDVPSSDGKAVTRMKQNRITRAIYVFRFNAPDDNRWNEPGYGWGRWDSLARASASLAT